MPFEFATAAAIRFGPGALNQAPDRLADWGKRALLVGGKNPRRHADFVERLEERGLLAHVLGVDGEPSAETVAEGVEQARRAGCDMVVGIGGGSVIDTGKAVAAMLTNTGSLSDYLEVVGRGFPLQHPSAPYMAIPTTAGTGAEVTRNAVLSSPKHRVKVSMRSPHMLPRMVVVDPQLTLSLPPEATAASGMDALTQLIEAFVSRKANPVTDGFCREGLPRCARSLLKAYQNGRDLNARIDMSLAALLSGLALANGGLGAVHGIAGPMGGRISIPHGVACASLLPAVYEANVRLLKAANHSEQILARYSETARLLTANPTAVISDGLAWIKRLGEQLQLPSLNRFGLEDEDIPVLAANAAKASSMRGNPVELGESELAAILKQARK